MQISPSALDLVKRYEGCSRTPDWPGGSSGITLGHGCDIGVNPDSLSFWRGRIPYEDFARLTEVCGLTGDAAAMEVASLSDIRLPQDACDDVLAIDLDRVADEVVRYFPGSDALPDDCFGAMVSLVFNRGPNTAGGRREEMLAIRGLIQGDRDRWPQVLPQFGSMTRLWNNGRPTVSNLAGRRLAEAALFAKGLDSIGLLFPGTLYVGAKGPAVRNLQIHLGAGSDGTFGLLTMISVFNWQAANGRPATGVWTGVWTQ